MSASQHFMSPRMRETTVEESRAGWARAQGGIEPAPMLSDDVEQLVAELWLGQIHTVAFVALGEETCTLPLYRAAITTARRGWALGIEDARYWLVTPEPAPLANYGTAASAAAAARLEPEAITFIGSTFAETRPGIVLLDPQNECLHVDRIVTLTRTGVGALPLTQIVDNPPPAVRTAPPA